MLTLLPADLSTPAIEYASDWNATAWIIWWALTGIAVALYLVGLRYNTETSYSSPIPFGVGLVMALAGYIFLFVAVAQMMRHSPDWKLIGLIVVVFLVISAVAGAALAGRGRVVWIVMGLLGAWTVIRLLEEWTTRSAFFMGISQFGFIALIALACVGFYSYAQRR